MVRFYVYDNFLSQKMKGHRLGHGNSCTSFKGLTDDF